MKYILSVSSVLIHCKNFQSTFFSDVLVIPPIAQSVCKWSSYKHDVHSSFLTHVSIMISLRDTHEFFFWVELLRRLRLGGTSAQWIRALVDFSDEKCFKKAQRLKQRVVLGRNRFRQRGRKATEMEPDSCENSREKKQCPVKRIGKLISWQSLLLLLLCFLCW